MVQVTSCILSACHPSVDFVLETWIYMWLHWQDKLQCNYKRKWLWTISQK